jgi:RNA polymerase sigma-70 factor, ECF subfamily
MGSSLPPDSTSPVPPPKSAAPSEEADSIGRSRDRDKHASPNIEGASKPKGPLEAVTHNGTGLQRSTGSLGKGGRQDEKLTEAAAPVSASREMEDFEAFYRREYQDVVGLVYAVGGIRVGAEDIAHDAFVEAYKRWDHIGRYEKPGAWVRRVAIQRAQRWHSRRSAEIRARARILLRLGEAGNVTELSAERAELWSAVRALPRRQAQVLFLYYQARYSVAEIADMLELAPGTVKAQLSNGRRALAKRLGEDARDSPPPAPDLGGSP